MYFVDRYHCETLEVKQSKFIAHLVPFSLYEETLHSLRQSHPKARHFVTASRYLNDFKQILEHSSDDGEPKGTSGKPTLMVMQGSMLINSAIIIVRYFGGTKLGTGGLVRAYSDAANKVIESATRYEYKEEIIQVISFEYANLRKVEYECEQNSILIVKKVFDTVMSYTLKSDITSMDKFLKTLDRLIYLP